MANQNTQHDHELINQQAAHHYQTAQAALQHATATKTTAENTAHASRSKMTGAVVQAAESFYGTMKKSSDSIHRMADSLKTAGGGLANADDESTRNVNNVMQGRGSGLKHHLG